MINTSINTLNKNKKIVYLEEETIVDEVASYNKEDEIDILSEVEKLDSRYKDVIILKYYDDLTVRDIANVLEIPIGTVKTYLNRGLKSLRVAMGEEWFINE